MSGDYDHGVGRPKEFICSIADMDNLRFELKLNWKTIQEHLKISKSTLRRWRIENKYEDEGKNFSTEELKTAVVGYLDGHYERGEIMTIGHVQALGIHASRKQIRNVINEVDPEGKEYRRKVFKKRVIRRVYDIKRPFQMCGKNYAAVLFFVWDF